MLLENGADIDTVDMVSRHRAEERRRGDGQLVLPRAADQNRIK
jgi:hypothetical protein